MTDWNITPAAFAAHWTATLQKCRKPHEVDELLAGHNLYWTGHKPPLTEAQVAEAKTRKLELEQEIARRGRR